MKDNWHVFYTKPRSEKKAEKRLLAQGYSVLVPKAEEIRQWSDRKKKVIVPLFAGYLFAKVDEKSRLGVLQTPEILCDIKFGGQPAVLQPKEIENLKIIQKKPDFIHPVDTPVPPVGSEVEINEGPFRGLVGEVMEVNNTTYLIIRIKAIGQAAKVKLPAVCTKVVA